MVVSDTGLGVTSNAGTGAEPSLANDNCVPVQVKKRNEKKVVFAPRVITAVLPVF
jgi:hypothetical protein